MTALTQDLSDMAGYWVTPARLVSVDNRVGGVQLVPANPLRWGLILAIAQAGAGGTTTVLPGSSVVPTVAFGIPLAVGAILEWHYRAWGGLVQQQWTGFTNGAGPNNVTVIEVLAQQ